MVYNVIVSYKKASMDFYKDSATIIRLDEVREMLLSLIKNSSNSSINNNNSLAEIKLGQNEILADVKSSLNNQTQINSKIDSVATKTQANDLANAIDEINVLLTSSSNAGLTDAQSQMLNQINTNVSLLLEKVGSNEDATTILTKLANIEQNIASIMQKLDMQNG